MSGRSAVLCVGVALAVVGVAWAAVPGPNGEYFSPKKKIEIQLARTHSSGLLCRVHKSCDAITGEWAGL